MDISSPALGLLLLSKFQSLGWQQCTGIQGFPAIAGALAQLVKIDLAAAEIALLTVLTQPVMARGMGAAAARRARHLFSPEVVMDAHEALFWNWRNAAGRHLLMLIAPDRSVLSSIPCECLLILHPTLPPPFNPLLPQFTRCLTLFGCSGLPYGESWSNRCRLRVLSLGKGFNLQAPSGVVCGSGAYSMTKLSNWTRFRHLLIASRWQRWLFPALCVAPYFSILVWLLCRGLLGCLRC